MDPEATSLLDANPSLARALRREAAAEITHVPILPLVTLDEGDRVPVGVFALVVLDGLLVSDARTMAGPGDLIADADAGWTACTAARIALVGAALVAAAGEWPGAVEALLARAVRWPVEVVSGGTLDERLLTLLWRLASHWGTPDDGGMTLRLALTPRGLARLMTSDERDVTAALAALADRGAVSSARDGGWTLSGGASHARRDKLRARGARQVALAREAVATFAALSDQNDQELRRSAARRSA